MADSGPFPLALGLAAGGSSVTATMNIPSAETSQRLELAYRQALAALLAERTAEGHWLGELSTSALSTATAVMALHLAAGDRQAELIDGGLSWLAAHQNPDGGWGDTVRSLSNISTTMLCRAAFRLTGKNATFPDATTRADHWMNERFGSTPQEHAEAVRRRYGKDRTFAVPILTTCALAGMLSWNEVPSLPFELACCPQGLFRFLRLHVVSYALPALIAIGQCVHHHRKPWNPLARLVRALSKRRSLRVLERIQPTNGGFLEATPLTSFVVLSLASIGLREHVVTRKGVDFIVSSVRPDGSWPIDTNLATWVTTLAVNALDTVGELAQLPQLDELHSWLTRQQFTQQHPYTGAAPGAFSWTPLPGAVPDADDTPGAILALANLKKTWPQRDLTLKWVSDLQNADGGWPTFCRGWGHLPFDRSGSDLTAHNLRALMVHGSANTRTIKRGLNYLRSQQRDDGAWLPLWFGNQHAPDDLNPTYGTARVLAAYRDLGQLNSEPARRGVRWLLDNQNDDGGWGGCKGTPSSVEETALALDIVLDATPQAAQKGLAWLIDAVERGELHRPTPIGFYFAKLWYFEKLYPIIFTVAALGRARRQLL